VHRAAAGRTDGAVINDSFADMTRDELASTEDTSNPLQSAMHFTISIQRLGSAIGAGNFPFYFLANMLHDLNGL
jgi:hypothetical protein